MEGAASNQDYYTNDRYRKTSPENIRDICEKYRYGALRKDRFKIHHKC